MPLRKELARTKMLAGQIKEADKLFRQYQSQVDNLDAGDLLLLVVSGNRQLAGGLRI